MTESTLPFDGKNADRGIAVDANGDMSYSGASESGHVSIMIPALPGSPRGTETLLARDYGQHVIGKIESAFQKNPYLGSGAQQTAPQVFRHYCAVAKGASLMDEGAIRRMEGLAREFDAAGEDDREFFQRVVKPYLGSLTPGKR